MVKIEVETQPARKSALPTAEDGRKQVNVWERLAAKEEDDSAGTWISVEMG